jgi:hypothetical protein
MEKIIVSPRGIFRDLIVGDEVPCEFSLFDEHNQIINEYDAKWELFKGTTADGEVVDYGEFKNNAGFVLRGVVVGSCLLRITATTGSAVRSFDTEILIKR